MTLADVEVAMLPRGRYKLQLSGALQALKQLQLSQDVGSVEGTHAPPGQIPPDWPGARLHVADMLIVRCRRLAAAQLAHVVVGRVLVLLTC